VCRRVAVGSKPAFRQGFLMRLNQASEERKREGGSAKARKVEDISFVCSDISEPRVSLTSRLVGARSSVEEVAEPQSLDDDSDPTGDCTTATVQ